MFTLPALDMVLEMVTISNLLESTIHVLVPFCTEQPYENGTDKSKELNISSVSP